jgi:hypothetical protein
MVDGIERVVLHDPGPGRVMVEWGAVGVSLYHEAGHTLSVELVDTDGHHHVQAIATNVVTLLWRWRSGPGVPRWDQHPRC